MEELHFALFHENEVWERKSERDVQQNSVRWAQDPILSNQILEVQHSLSHAFAIGAALLLHLFLLKKLNFFMLPHFKETFFFFSFLFFYHLNHFYRKNLGSAGVLYSFFFHIIILFL